MHPNSAQQVDLFRLDWLPLGEATRLCGLADQWLADELLAGHLKGISTRVASVGNEWDDPWGLLVWMPSLGLWLQSHRDLHTSAMGLLRDGATAAGSSTGRR